MFMILAPQLRVEAPRKPPVRATRPRPARFGVLRKAVTVSVAVTRLGARLFAWGVMLMIPLRVARAVLEWLGGPSLQLKESPA